MCDFSLVTRDVLKVLEVGELVYNHRSHILGAVGAINVEYHLTLFAVEYIIKNMVKSSK